MDDRLVKWAQESGGMNKPDAIDALGERMADLARHGARESELYADEIREVIQPLVDALEKIGRAHTDDPYGCIGSEPPKGLQDQETRALWRNNISVARTALATLNPEGGA